MRTNPVFCLLALALAGWGDAEPPLPPPPELLGRWRDDIPAYGTIEFRPDGTVQEINPFRVGDGQYRPLGRNQIEVDMYDNPGVPRVYAYHLVGDRLVLDPPLPVVAQKYTRVR